MFLKRCVRGRTSIIQDKHIQEMFKQIKDRGSYKSRECLRNSHQFKTKNGWRWSLSAFVFGFFLHCSITHLCLIFKLITITYHLHRLHTEHHSLFAPYSLIIQWFVVFLSFIMYHVFACVLICVFFFYIFTVSCCCRSVISHFGINKVHLSICTHTYSLFYLHW